MFGNIVNYLKDKMPHRIVKNILAVIFIMLCINAMFAVYNKIMDEIVEQQVQINDRDIDTLSGEEIKNKNNISGHANYSTDVEYKEKEEEVIEEKKFVELKISIKYYVLFAFCSILLGAVVAHTCVSKFHKRSFVGTFRNVVRNVIMGVVTGLVASSISVIFILNMNSYKKELDAENLQMIKESAKIKFEGSEVVDENESKDFKGTYKSIVSDQCVFVAQNGGSIKVEKSVIDKSGIDCFNLEYAQNYGVNSAVLAINKGKADVKASDIYADSKGASGFYAKGEGSQIVVDSVNMQVLGRAGAYGIVASEKGKVEVKESEIMTNGDECPVVLSKKTGGKIKVENTTLMTFGYNSPIAHVSKNVSFNNVTGGTKCSNLLYIDSGANMSLKNSKLSGGIGDVIGEKEETAILIKSDVRNYENRKEAIVTIEDSSINVNLDSKYYRKAPIFRVSNMEATINLTNTELNFGSKIIMDLKHEPNVGITTQNGGHVKFKTDAQKLVGFIKVDDYSTLAMNMTNGSVMYGGINYNNTKSGKVELKMDSSSKLILASNCYLTKFENEDASNSNVVFGKFKIFVNGKPIQ